MANNLEEIGRHKTELDTPALLVDVDILDRNIAKMMQFLRGGQCALRPHFKAHRSAAITRRQLAAGGIGVTCAKLGEAEYLADQGFDHLLVANELYGEIKWERLARLAQRVEAIVAVDHLQMAQGIARAARDAGSEVGVVVDVNVGLNRCGVEPGTPALELARRVAGERGLRLRGVMGYEGGVGGLPADEKQERCQTAMRRLTESAEMIRADGLPVEIVTGGGTTSYTITARCPGITEVQCGTYAVMDLVFRERSGADFDYAVTVLGTVISRPFPERGVTDAGRKALHPSSGPSRMIGVPGGTLAGLNSEHGLLALDGAAKELPLGAKVRFIPHSVEGTINLHDRMYAVQNDRVVDVWEIAGRSASR